MMIASKSDALAELNRTADKNNRLRSELAKCMAENELLQEENYKQKYDILTLLSRIEIYKNSYDKLQAKIDSAVKGFAIFRKEILCIHGEYKIYNYRPSSCDVQSVLILRDESEG